MTLSAAKKKASKRRAQTKRAALTNAAASAKAAGLHYITDATPGIHRAHAGRGFRYFDPSGAPIHDPATLRRIKALVIPTGWREVWISPIPDGHLQLTGRDQRGRKQSRFHPRWLQLRNENKYQRMVLFGDALPAIREQVDHDLALPGLPRAKVLATVVRLMETTFLRIGNEEPAEENVEHARENPTDGRSETVSVDVENRSLANIVRHSLDLPGYELFQYLDQDGNRHSVDAADVNDYLRQITGQPFTAKDFRTWAGSILAATVLSEFEPFEDETQAQHNIAQAIETVAERLGTTPTACRKCYIHPLVFERYLKGATLVALEAGAAEEATPHHESLRDEESDLLNLLTHRADWKPAKKRNRKTWTRTRLSVRA
jgi:DNA topoisomerase I